MKTKSVFSPKPGTSFPTAPRISALVLLIGLIAGRFDLARVSPTLEGVDVRWLFGLAALVAAAACLPYKSKAASPGLVAFGLALTTWLLWILTSSAWAPPGARLSEYALDILFLSFFLACSISTFQGFNARDWRLLWLTLLAVATLYLVAAIIAGPGDQGRYSAFGGGPNVFVRIMGLGALSALAIYLSTRRATILLVIPAFAFGAVLSGSRGGLAAAGCIAIVAIPSVVRRLGAKRAAGILALLAAASGLLLVLFGDRAATLFNERVVQLTLVQRYSSGRDQIVDAAIDLFAQQPLRGVGIDGYYGLVGQYAGLEYPHNLFLAAAAEGGLIGVILLVAALLAVGAGLLTARPLPTDSLVLGLASTFMLISSMFSGDYYDSRFIWFFAAAALIAASSAAQTTATHDVSKSVT